MAWERAEQWSLLVGGDAETNFRVGVPKGRKDENAEGVDLPKVKSMMLLEVKPLTESKNVHASSAQLVNAKGETLLWQRLSMVSGKRQECREVVATPDVASLMRKTIWMTSSAQHGSVRTTTTWDVLTTARLRRRKATLSSCVRQNVGQMALRRKIQLTFSNYNRGTLGLTQCTLFDAYLTAPSFASNIWHCCPVAEQVA
jgi:hypothetical protein